jgi:hypothetical protein
MLFHDFNQKKDHVQKLWRLQNIIIGRRETKYLMELLRRAGMPADKISPAAPALARCFIQRQIKYTNILVALSILANILAMFPIVLFSISKSMDLKWQRVFVTYFLFSLTFIIAMAVIHKIDDEYRRRHQFSTGCHNLMIKYAWIVGVGLALFWLLVSLLMIKVDGRLFTLNIYGVVLMGAQSLLMMVYLILAYWLARIILRWRAPELTLVRALADAFEIIVAANHANWRSISLRGRAAHYIDKAALTLEGPIAQKFTASARFSDAVAIQRRFEMAGAALRSKVAWLATPMAETKSFLASALADQLLIVATGDLDRLEYSKIEQVHSTTGNWLARLRATASWTIVGVGPVILFIVSSRVGWFEQYPAGAAIFGQFAAASLIAAVFYAVDPSGGKDRLSSVIATESALFNGKKAETKD